MMTRLASAASAINAAAPPAAWTEPEGAKRVEAREGAGSEARLPRERSERHLTRQGGLDAHGRQVGLGELQYQRLVRGAVGTRHDQHDGRPADVPEGPAAA